MQRYAPTCHMLPFKGRAATELSYTSTGLGASTNGSVKTNGSVNHARRAPPRPPAHSEFQARSSREADCIALRARGSQDVFEPSRASGTDTVMHDTMYMIPQLALSDTSGQSEGQRGAPGQVYTRPTGLDRAVRWYVALEGHRSLEAPGSSRAHKESTGRGQNSESQSADGDERGI
ncbi:hypothetical protein FKP32DRAFT_873671 [Trametes sanguinea]|nr:hypothetical protein FKP32DRAFT_873671 [Trametes sanguinea]